MKRIITASFVIVVACASTSFAADSIKIINDCPQTRIFKITSPTEKKQCDYQKSLKVDKNSNNSLPLSDGKLTLKDCDIKIKVEGLESKAKFETKKTQMETLSVTYRIKDKICQVDEANVSYENLN